MQARRLPPQKTGSTVIDRRYRNAPHCGDFDRRHKQRFLFLNIGTSKATKFAGKSSIKAVHFCSREIGGTKNRGPAPSGICNLRIAIWFALLNRTGHGDWLASTTELE